ncbi:YkuS family protein [Brevibacillus composti]|uniref:YkuS family protein n=1 Tax=Brevibacillus composti TaxID=2796470 RepID=A0A7T5EHW8_9BACL|nr:YkuS family protein [Brevibacillus composti]QQE72925.1 YkuS family protein [Brevibacillus composti]QUO40003.1 YkuS family protein [Brevibacillus composti]
MARVAVEGNLTQISQMLRDNGYQVVELGNWQNPVDAVVITGQDVNVLSDQSKTITGAPVINANGMTAQEVFHAVHVRLSPTRHH